MITEKSLSSYVSYAEMTQGLLIIPLKNSLKVTETGNKARSLLFLQKHKFRIPVTFIVPAQLHENYLNNKSSFLKKLREEVLRLPEKPYAIRSSTTSEDSEDYTFAGQFQTFTNVTGSDNIIKAIQDVWDSAACCKETEYHKRALNTKPGCAVIIQEMVNSKLAGVSFSKNPLTNQQEVIIEAVEGPGEDLVQKGLTPIRWRFRKEHLLEGISEHIDIPVIKKIAADTEYLRHLFRNHVDIEWSYDGNHLYYLQFRNITGKRQLNIYSNKLAQEMLPGQIKPLVWSINIPLVNGTWIEILSEITGRLDIRPEDLAKSFYYRTYFNIAALSEIFREFGLSTEALEILMLSRDDSKPSFKPGIRTFRHSFRIAKFIHHKLTFEKVFIREYNRLRIFYKEAGRKVLNEFSLSSYPQLYSQLFEEGHNLTYLNIIAPLLMQVYNKRLKNKLKKLGIDYDLLDFNSDFPELQALSPLSSLIKIKGNINSLPDAVKSECSSFEMLKKFPEASEIIDDISDFIKEFGHLSESGNDFSVPKWEEDPENLFKLIMKTESVETKSGFFPFDELDKRGISRISGLQKSYMKAGRFKVYREQISSLFIYGHGLFRSLFLNLGRVFKSYEIIASADDIFYLNIKEINNILGEISSEKVKSYNDVIAIRKNEMEATRDLVLPSVIYGEQAPILEIGKLKNHRGIGTSAGSYTGKTRVIKGINDFDSVIKGDVILIPFSDVSWTPILTLAGSIVSETGGLLSHCSIIAREMGIPALVSVENACTIGNGLKVTVDGSNGILTIHDYE